MGRKVRENPIDGVTGDKAVAAQAQIISTGPSPRCAVLYLAPGWSGMR